MGRLLTIEDMQSLANSRGGQCLFKEYHGAQLKLRWRCAKGHEWEASPAGILSSRRTWCPYCASKAKLTIDEMKEIVKSCGGECISQHYVNGRTKLNWRCRFGHEWMAAPDNVKNNGNWCSVCAKKRVVKKYKND